MGARKWSLIDVENNLKGMGLMVTKLVCRTNVLLIGKGNAAGLGWMGMTIKKVKLLG